VLFASAVPLVAGATDRYRRLGEELQPHRRRYEELNAIFDIAGHAHWISHARTGVDIGISVYDISADGLARMRERRWDPGSDYDRWWLGFVEEVNGVDMQKEPPHAAPPEVVFSWRR
jgi:hypothetical protein